MGAWGKAVIGEQSSPLRRPRQRLIGSCSIADKELAPQGETL